MGEWESERVRERSQTSDTQTGKQANKLKGKTNGQSSHMETEDVDEVAAQIPGRDVGAGERVSGSGARWYNMNKMNKLAYVMRLLGRNLGGLPPLLLLDGAPALHWLRRGGRMMAGGGRGAPHLEICLNAALIICHEIFIARYH